MDLQIPDDIQGFLDQSEQYCDRKMYAEAESVLRLALASCCMEYDEAHPLTAKVYSELGCVCLYAPKRLEEGQQLMEKALAIREAQLPLDHPDMGRSFNDLGCVYGRQERYEEAERFLVRSLKIRRHHHGTEDEKTLLTLANLGSLYQVQKRYDEAEPLLKLAFEQGRKLPPEAKDFDLIYIGHLLEKIYREQERYEALEPLLLTLLSAYRQKHGANHPGSVLVLNNLGTLYKSLERYHDAESTLLMAQRIAAERNATEPINTIRIALSLSEIYIVQKRHRQALETVASVMPLVGNPPCVEPIEHLNLCRFLGLSYSGCKDYSQAEHWFMETFALAQQYYGDESPQLCTDLINLAQLYWNTGRKSEAVELGENALFLQQRDTKASAESKAMTYGAVAMLYHTAENRKRAGELYEYALELWQSAGKDISNHTAVLMASYANFLTEQGNLWKAARLRKQAAAIRADWQARTHA